MSRSKRKAPPPQGVVSVSISKNEVHTATGIVSIPTIAALKKKYGAIADEIECPRSRLKHAQKALEYGLTPTVDLDGLIGIPGWDWHSSKPITLSAVEGLKGKERKSAIAMLHDPGFMGSEPKSSSGLVTDEVRKLFQ